MKILSWIIAVVILAMCAGATWRRIRKPGDEDDEPWDYYEG
jgi:hypothetical protein